MSILFVFFTIATFTVHYNYFLILISVSKSAFSTNLTRRRLLLSVFLDPMADRMPDDSFPFTSFFGLPQNDI